MRVLFFALLEIVFFPLQLIGSLVYAFRVRFVNMPRGISGTAYEPYMTRLLLHHIKSRNDEAAERIAPHLPALSPLVLRLMVDTLVLAARWSGFRGSFLAYPGPRPSTLATFISHRTHFFDNAVAAAAVRGESHPAVRRARRGLGHALRTDRCRTERTCARRPGGTAARHRDASRSTSRRRRRPRSRPCAPPASTAATSSSRRPTSTSNPGWSR